MEYKIKKEAKRTQTKKALEELDATVDSALADVKPKVDARMRQAQPKVDDFISLQLEFVAN